jgi:hypothetical protein
MVFIMKCKLFVLAKATSCSMPLDLANRQKKGSGAGDGREIPESGVEIAIAPQAPQSSQHQDLKILTDCDTKKIELLRSQLFFLT